MSKKYNVTFSVGQYDSDGNKYDDGIFLHMDRGDFIVRVASGDDLDSLIEALIRCRIELVDTKQAEFDDPDKWHSK